MKWIYVKIIAVGRVRAIVSAVVSHCCTEKIYGMRRLVLWPGTPTRGNVARSIPGRTRIEDNHTPVLVDRNELLEFHWAHDTTHVDSFAERFCFRLERRRAVYAQVKLNHKEIP